MSRYKRVLVMLSINDLKNGTIVKIQGDPYAVLSVKHLHMGRGGSSVQTRIKNLRTGQVLERNFKPSDEFEEVEIEKEKVKFIYEHRGQYWFAPLEISPVRGNPSMADADARAHRTPNGAAAVPKGQGGSLTGFDEFGNLPRSPVATGTLAKGLGAENRFALKAEDLGDTAQFLKPNLEVLAMKYEDRIISVELPIKVDYKVVEAPPTVRGNTAQGGTKVVVIESGAKISVPLFINEGDIIRVNTQTGEYAERIEKA